MATPGRGCRCTDYPVVLGVTRPLAPAAPHAGMPPSPAGVACGMGASHGSASTAGASSGGPRHPTGLRAVAWAAAAGVAGFVISIALGVAATVVTFILNPNEGASFIGISFWMAGPPVSALVMAGAALWRRWDPVRVWQSAAVTFVVCLGCGVFIMTTLPGLRVPPLEPSRFEPPITSLPSGGEPTE